MENSWSKEFYTNYPSTGGIRKINDHNLLGKKILLKDVFSKGKKNNLERKRKWKCVGKKLVKHVCKSK